MTKILSYIGFAIAFFAVLSGVFGWIDPAIVWSVAGVFGFTGVASLRSFLNVQGWKVAFVAIVGIVAGVLSWAGLIELSHLQQLYSFLITLTGAALTHTAVKIKK